MRPQGEGGVQKGKRGWGEKCLSLSHQNLVAQRRIDATDENYILAGVDCLHASGAEVEVACRRGGQCVKVEEVCIGVDGVWRSRCLARKCESDGVREGTFNSGFPMACMSLKAKVRG